jgi:hypothetical protein
MKKFYFIAGLALATLAAVYLVSPSSNSKTALTSGGTTQGASGEPGSGSLNTSSSSGDLNELSGSNSPEQGEAQNDAQASKPANEVYTSAEDALNAVKNGASNYDDTILEQFTLVGQDCAWCDNFYKSMKDLVTSPSTSNDEKSYFAEILAISGRVDNVNSLLQAIESAPSSDVSEIYSEALEMTIGKDDVVKFLGSKLNTNNNTLKESIVAAISNQGSPLAIDTLYKQSRDSGNPDGFYSQGTGLGEVIPDQDSFPQLKSFMDKKDDYSHLAVKSLLNAGYDGLKVVAESLQNSKDSENDKKILKDAADHVSYDEETEKYIKDLAEKSSNPALTDFAKSVQASFASNEASDPFPAGQEGGQTSSADSASVEEEE